MTTRHLWFVALGIIAIGAVIGLAMRNSRSRLATATPVSKVADCESCPSVGPITFAPTVSNSPTAPGSAPARMVWIPGGEFSMSSTVESESLCSLPGVTRDALPVHRVYVDGFWMDATELTNEDFEKFVNATGYITVAERTPTAEEFPGAPPENLVAGSTVFTPTKNTVALDNYYQWWR